MDNSGNCRILYVVGKTTEHRRAGAAIILSASIYRSRPLQARCCCLELRRDDMSCAAYPRLGGSSVSQFSGASSKDGQAQALRRLVRQLRTGSRSFLQFSHQRALPGRLTWHKATAIGSVRSDFNLAEKESGPVLGRLCARWPAYQIFNSFSAAAARVRHVLRPQKIRRDN